MTTRTFPFRIDERYAIPLRLFGVRAGSARVELDDWGITARFGRFVSRAPWQDVRDACVDGPYRWYRVIGPHLSLADKGVTYGSNADAGTCVRFHRPVAGLFGPRRMHPGMTVTVEDPDGLRAAIEQELRDRIS